MKLNTKSLNEIERGFPILAEQVLFAQLSSEIKPSKNTGNDILVITCRILDEEVMKKDGTPMKNEGAKLKFTYNVSLAATEKYNPDTMLAQIADAITKEGDEPLDELDSDMIQDAYCKVKLGIRPANEKYNESNYVKALLPIKGSDNFTPPVL